jgi:nucleotide-binding universal stress UspA family protein
MIGSVGERLLKGGPCSVAVAPRGYADREHFGAGVIGVGYDDSTESRLALEAAVELARAVGGSVRLIAVMPDHLTSGPIGGADIGDSQVVRADLEAALEKAAEGIAGIGVETVIEQGDVVDELAGQAVELDLLVLGSRGYGPIRRALLGGVSAPMTRVCPCPLLITPRSGEERERPVRDRSLSSALDQDADKRTAESMDR